MPRDRFVAVVGVDIEGQGCIAVELVWNGSAWVPNLHELRRLLWRAAVAQAGDEYDVEEED